MNETITLCLEIIFWLALFIVFYTYLGYGIVLYVLVKLKELFVKPVKRSLPASDADLPEVTLFITAFNEIKIAGLYKKYCWDMITIMVILVSMAIAIYFGDWIKEVLPINLLFLLLFVQLVYVGIRWYVKGWRENRGYV